MTRELIEQNDETEAPARAVCPTSQLAAGGTLYEVLESRPDQLVLLSDQLRVGFEPETGTALERQGPRGRLALALQLAGQRLAEPELAHSECIVHYVTPSWP